MAVPFEFNLPFAVYLFLIGFLIKELGKLLSSLPVIIGGVVFIIISLLVIIL